jgi:hypothetical protein
MNNIGQNMMYYGAVINSGARENVLSPVDMTCQAINSTHYICRIVERQAVPNDAGMVVLAIVCGFILFISAVIICELEGWM